MTDDIAARLQRANEAENFLGNDLVKSLVLRQKERLFTLWANTKPDEREKRENLYTEYRGLLSMINELRGYVVDGQALQMRAKADE